jgi:hypothetical protein
MNGDHPTALPDDPETFAFRRIKDSVWRGRTSSGPALACAF